MSADPRPVQRVAIIGAGTMGVGIAIASMEAGLSVTLIDEQAAALARASRRLQDHFASRVSRGRLKASDAADCEARCQVTRDWPALRHADLVIEAVVEVLEVKQSVFRRIDADARAGAVLATNTSYLDVDAIAAATSRPADVIGLHFFSPAHVMRLIEVVRGAASSGDALATGLAYAERLGKRPIVTANAFGFVGNRLYAAYRRHCEFMLEDGASPAQVDGALRDFGFAMGPFAVADLSGLDIAWQMRKATAASRDPSARYVHVPDRLCEAGRFGRKTGAGYYRYLDGDNSPHHDAFTDALIDRCRRDKGMVARPLTDEEIVRRAITALTHEAARLLAEGVAARAEDIDAALVDGYGYPRHQAGVVAAARARGADELLRDFAWLDQISAAPLAPADPRHLLTSPSTGALP